MELLETALLDSERREKDAKRQARVAEEQSKAAQEALKVKGPLLGWKPTLGLSCSNAKLCHQFGGFEQQSGSQLHVRIQA